MTNHAEALRKLVSGRVLQNEPMAGHTTFGVGGPADLLVEVSKDSELAAALKYISASDLPWMILGSGANLLISDKGIRGVVISLAGDFQRIEADGNRLTAGAAVAISTAADFAAAHDLCGLEGAGTIPGTVGGAIVMNAGTHRGYISEVVESVAIIARTGERQVLSRDECGFTYRGSRFQHDLSIIITSVTFALQPGDGAASREHIDATRRHRSQTQPKGKSAGCFFKNPPDGSAGRLIDQAGGKGLREGGAIVSDIHANFIINTGNATASDIRTLAERIRELVREKHGVELEYEVRMVGEW